MSCRGNSPLPCPGKHRWPTTGARGFSLIELVTVIVVLGVVAAVAAPYLGGTQQVYGDLGFYNDTRAILRYAQKSAIASRRTVCVTFTATSVTLTQAQTPNSLNCGANNLTGPGSENPYTVSASGPTTFAPVPTDFSFNSLGQPVDTAGALLPNQNIVIAGGVTNVVVEADTGYVR